MMIAIFIVSAFGTFFNLFSEHANPCLYAVTIMSAWAIFPVWVPILLLVGCVIKLFVD